MNIVCEEFLFNVANQETIHQRGLSSVCVCVCAHEEADEAPVSESCWQIQGRTSGFERTCLSRAQPLAPIFTQSAAIPILS